jgi:hypothetical protein
MFNLTREDQAPWVQAGTWAINQLAGTPGTPEQVTKGAPIYGQPATGAGTTGNALAGISGSSEPWTFYDANRGTWITRVNGIDYPSGTADQGPVMPPAAQAAAQQAAAPQIIGYEPDQVTPATAGTPGLIEQGPGEFVESPSYQFALGEGLKGIQRMASATGRLGSGASMKAASRYAEDLASQEYDNFLRRWYQSLDPYFSLAGLGQMSAGQSGQNALATGRGVASSYLSRGEAQAAGQLGQAYPYNALLNYGAGQGMNWAANNVLSKYNPPALTNSQWWGQTAYTPQGVNSMGWL